MYKTQLNVNIHNELENNISMKMDTSLIKANNLCYQQLYQNGQYFYNEKKSADTCPQSLSGEYSYCQPLGLEYNYSDLSERKDLVEQQNLESGSKTDVKRGDHTPLMTTEQCNWSRFQTGAISKLLIALTTFRVSMVLPVLSQPLTMMCLYHLLIPVTAWMPDIRPDLLAS